ncbi:MAG: hypothetical protein Q4C54_04575 [Clostridia bacterium]|nr:hypothetical protein [Clostridia bacterium]
MGNYPQTQQKAVELCQSIRQRLDEIRATHIQYKNRLAQLSTTATKKSRKALWFTLLGVFLTEFVFIIFNISFLLLFWLEIAIVVIGIVAGRIEKKAIANKEIECMVQ